MNSLQLYNYNDRSYIITGNVDYRKEEMRALGGVKTSNGFIFDKSNTDVQDLINLVTLANAGKMLEPNSNMDIAYNIRKIQYRPPILTNNVTTTELPLKMQKVEYLLPRPKVGDNILVNNYEYHIINTKSTGTFITYFDIKHGYDKDEVPLRVIIKDGKWTVDLPNIGPHTITFL